MLEDEKLGVDFQGHRFIFEKTKQVQVIVNEVFNDNYKVLAIKLEFKPRDIIIDAGANEGVFSIFMSKLFPKTKIYAIEPVPSTFEILEKNIALNRCKNIFPFNVGFAGPETRTASLIVSKDYSGGSTKWCTFNPNHHNREVCKFVTIDLFIRKIKAKEIALMKMDIEGMEYEALYASSLLDRIKNFTGEFHHNRKLDFATRRADGLVNWLAKKTNVIFIELCGMAE